MSKSNSKQSLTEKQKEQYVVERVKYWTNRLGVGGKTVEVTRMTDADDEDDDGATSYIAELEEVIVTSMERALMDKDAERARKVTGKNRGQVMADVDDSIAEYGYFKVRLYPALMSYDGEEFKLVADSTICHECIHMALWPYTLYATHLYQKGEKK